MIKPYYEENGITIFNCDCRDILPHLPKVDLVLTDPPYGINYELTQNAQSESGRTSYRRGYWKTYDVVGWDSLVENNIILSCIRKGKNAIIWGGHHYNLPLPSGWLIWNKVQRGYMSDGEAAWTNVTAKIRLYDLARSDAYINNREDKQHPTQKPSILMKWCIGLSKTSGIILDPFMELRHHARRGEAAKAQGYRH